MVHALINPAERTVGLTSEAMMKCKAAAVRYKNCRIAAYQNMALDSAFLGTLKFMAVGPENTFKEAPERLPDMPQQINWAYLHVGYLNLTDGTITKE